MSRVQNIAIDTTSKYELAVILSGLSNDPAHLEIHETVKDLFDLKSIITVAREATSKTKDKAVEGINTSDKEEISSKPLKLKIATNSNNYKQTKHPKFDIDAFEKFFFVFNSKHKDHFVLSKDLVEGIFEEIFPTYAEKKLNLKKLNQRAINEGVPTNTRDAFNASKNKKASKPNSSFKIAPKNKIQQKHRDTIHEKMVVISEGASGTGKTLISCLAALELLYDENSPVERIYITRPPEGTGKSLGFLPGSTEDKMAPWIRPVLDNMRDVLPNGKQDLDKLVRAGKIEVVDIDSIRGRTLKNGVFIVDEAQNISEHILKALTARPGENLKLIINGDFEQEDIKNSGFRDLVTRLENSKDPRTNDFVEVITYTTENVLRSELSKFMQDIYREDIPAVNNNNKKHNGPT